MAVTPISQMILYLNVLVTGPITTLIFNIIISADNHPYHPNIYMALIISGLINNSITMHVYIVYTVLLSLTQTCFQQVHISTPNGAYNTCCH